MAAGYELGALGTLWLFVASVVSPFWDQDPQLLCCIGLCRMCPRRLCPLLGLQAGCGQGVCQVSASQMQVPEEEEPQAQNTWP